MSKVSPASTTTPGPRHSSSSLANVRVASRAISVPPGTSRSPARTKTLAPRATGTVSESGTVTGASIVLSVPSVIATDRTAHPTKLGIRFTLGGHRPLRRQSGDGDALKGGGSDAPLSQFGEERDRVDQGSEPVDARAVERQRDRARERRSRDREHDTRGDGRPLDDAVDERVERAFAFAPDL